MTTILVYAGIALIIGGWLSLAWFASKQIRAKKEYERLPQRWEEVKHDLIHKRTISRCVVMLGLVFILIFLLVSN